MCPEQLRHSLGWIQYFSLLDLSTKKERKLHQKNPTPGMQLAPFIEDLRCQPSTWALLVHPLQGTRHP